ncbi:MAG: MFS transporter [Gammaproteobacteria bacterium]|nr:MFS transporter [Gammaproteobacteria bacterium]
MKHLFNKRTLSWAMYDWANSAYATIVMAVFFQLLFSDYWFHEPGGNSTTPLGIANAVGSLVVVILAPILGAIADRGGLKKHFLFFFTIVGVLFTCALYFVHAGEWMLALTIFVLGGIGFSGANVFYDAMLVDVTTEDKFDIVSSAGYGLGYLGGGLALVFSILFYAKKEWFGFTSGEQAQLASFILTGIWWALFSLPLLFAVKETRTRHKEPIAKAISHGFMQIKQTFREIRNLKVVFLFLAAYWLYIDGVDTIMRMAADYGKRLGFDDNDLIMALLITQFVGFPAAIIYGKLGEKFGTKPALLVAVAVYIGVTVYGYAMDEVRDFYILAITVGLVQGGIQSLSRSMYARIIPKNKSAEFFGFYNMLGKLAAVLGPLLMAIVSHMTGSARLSILSVIILFVIGGVLLLFVNEEEGHRMVRELE